MVNASDVVIDMSQEIYRKYWNRSLMEVSFNILPYVDPEEFRRYILRSYRIKY